MYLQKLNSRLLNFVESSLIQERNKIITKKVQVCRWLTQSKLSQSKFIKTILCF